MNYDQEPVSALLRGPMLHTAQGWVVLFFTVTYLLAAAVSYALDEPLFGLAKSTGVFIVLCVAWPGILFIAFVRENAPHFGSSFGKAGLLAFYGVLPLLFQAYDAWTDPFR